MWKIYQHRATCNDVEAIDSRSAVARFYWC